MVADPNKILLCKYCGSKQLIEVYLPMTCKSGETSSVYDCLCYLCVDCGRILFPSATLQDVGLKNISL